MSSKVVEESGALLRLSLYWFSSRANRGINDSRIVIARSAREC